MPDSFLYERVYNYVLEQIRDGSLHAGDRVPSEMDLAARFGVSRITSKRALHMLAEAGVLQRRRGKGSFVAENIASLRTLPARTTPRSERPPPASSCVALVIPEVSDAYGLDLLRAIEERCAEHGYHLVVRRTRDRQDREEEAVQTLAGSGLVDGLIVFPVHGEFYNASLVRLVFDHRPLVLVDRYLRGIPACSVHTDNRAAASALTGQLLDNGHQRLAFFSPPVTNTSSIEERIDGFELAIGERGLAAEAGRRFTEVRSTMPGTADSQPDRGGQADRDAIREFVERSPEVTGFVACEYNIALLLRDVLSELRPAGGWEIGCFDSPDASSPFVHIEQDQREMGRRAVDLLLAQLHGEDVPPHSVIPFRLVRAV